MELNMEKVLLKDMTDKQFREWLLPIVEHTLFVYRERILELLTIDADRDTLTEAFREFFEAYYYDVAFELDRYEKCLLSVLDSCDTYYEFFVCHLELEQFLEDYEYDPDEGLETRPEVVEELEQSITHHETGEIKGRPLQFTMGGRRFPSIVY